MSAQIYSQCAEEFRLNVEGAFHVQRNEVDEYCGGPCLEETQLALQCVEEVAAQSFKFSNGASVLAVKQALGAGCSYGPDRGKHTVILLHLMHALTPSSIPHACISDD